MNLAEISKTMNHIQIAELLGKRSDAVKRTIARLEKKGVISYTPMVEMIEIGKGGKRETNCYHVNERDSYIVVAQLSPEFTAKLVDEWNRLRNIIKHNLIENPYTKEAQKAKALLDAGFTIEQIKTLTFNESKAVLGLPPLPDTHKTIKMMNLTSWIEIDGKNVNIANRLMKISKAMKLEILKAPHDIHGTVNAYHKDAFKILLLDIE